MVVKVKCLGKTFPEDTETIHLLNPLCTPSLFDVFILYSCQNNTIIHFTDTLPSIAAIEIK